MKSYDLIVCGGGPGGVMAAIQAGRLGVRTLLIERHGFLGGMNTAGLVGPIMTFHAGKLQIVRGIPGEIFETLRERGGTPGHLQDPIWGNTSMTPIDTEAYKALLLEEVARAGVELLLHSLVLEGRRSGERVESIRVSNKAGIQEYSARAFIDATGDGDLAARLGCEFIMGREKDHAVQPMTLMFRMGGVDWNAVYAAIEEEPSNFYLGLPLEEYLGVPGRAVSGFFRQVTEGKRNGTFPLDRDRVLFFQGAREDEATVNTLRINGVNGTVPEDLTRAEFNLRRQVPTLVRFLRESIPGFSKAYVTETATQVGVRETRHILGDYVLRAEDVFRQTRFEDTVAHASYPIDIHSPDGSGMKIIDPRKDDPESFYDVPFRCLLPRGVANLIVTGRCISAEHEASASARISATCMALGQASGVAVARFIAEERANFREISISTLRRTLREQGAFLRPE